MEIYLRPTEVKVVGGALTCISMLVMGLGLWGLYAAAAWRKRQKWVWRVEPIEVIDVHPSPEPTTKANTPSGWPNTTRRSARRGGRRRFAMHKRDTIGLLQPLCPEPLCVCMCLESGFDESEHQGIQRVSDVKWRTWSTTPMSMMRRS